MLSFMGSPTAGNRCKDAQRQAVSYLGPQQRGLLAVLGRWLQAFPWVLKNHVREAKRWEALEVGGREYRPCRAPGAPGGPCDGQLCRSSGSPGVGALVLGLLWHLRSSPGAPPGCSVAPICVMVPLSMLQGILEPEELQLVMRAHNPPLAALQVGRRAGRGLVLERPRRRALPPRQPAATQASLRSGAVARCPASPTPAIAPLAVSPPLLHPQSSHPRCSPSSLTAPPSQPSSACAWTRA